LDQTDGIARTAGGFVDAVELSIGTNALADDNVGLAKDMIGSGGGAAAFLVGGGSFASFSAAAIAFAGGFDGPSAGFSDFLRGLERFFRFAGGLLDSKGLSSRVSGSKYSCQTDTDVSESVGENLGLVFREERWRATISLLMTARVENTCDFVESGRGRFGALPH